MNNLKVLENELVPVYETDTGEKVVYGSELHAVLEVKSRFNDWVRNRLNDVDATENGDYEAFTKNLVSGGRTKDYIIKLDTAKEMAMLERNEKGKQVRRYFIAVEKKYKEVQEVFADPEEIFNWVNEAVEQHSKQEGVPWKNVEHIIETVATCSNDRFPYVAGILQAVGVCPYKDEKVVWARQKEAHEYTQNNAAKGVEIHGDRLADRMELLGLTNKSLAEQLECDPSVISKWKNGGKPLRENFILLCQALKCEPSYLRVRKRNGKRIKQ